MSVVTSTLAHLLQEARAAGARFLTGSLQDLYPPGPLCPSLLGPDESEPDESEPGGPEPGRPEPGGPEPDEFEPDESEPDEAESEPDESEPEADESEPDVSEPGPLLLPSEPELDDARLGPLELLSTLGPLESGCVGGSPLGLSCEPGPALSETG